MTLKRAFFTVLCTTAIAGIASCSELAGLGEYDSPLTAGAGPDAGGVTAPPIGVAVPSSCAGEKADENAGVFVAQWKAAAAECGSKATPCSSIQAGLERAIAMQKAIVYVGKGTYVETVTTRAGLTVQGGWDVTTGSRICTPDRAGSVTIKADDASNVTVIASGAMAALDTLTIVSRGAPARAGESLYGIRATAPTTVRDVTVRVGNAGAGAPGIAGTLGSIPLAGTCLAGDGAAGKPGGPGAGAGVGAFSAEGYQPAKGADGLAGSAGNAGAATKGECPTGCESCLSQPENGECGKPLCGKDGVPGCPGAGGTPGHGGGGGGSSIAVFASGANVTVQGGGLFAGNGGNGGAGGEGGAAGSAVAVAPPGKTKCQGCILAFGVCNPPFDTGDADNGMSGAGGSGGAGGAGGGGSGGHSYAVFRAAGAKVNPTGTKLGIGQAGGGGAGPGVIEGKPGKAGEMGP